MANNIFDEISVSGEEESEDNLFDSIDSGTGENIFDSLPADSGASTGIVSSETPEADTLGEAVTKKVLNTADRWKGIGGGLLSMAGDDKGALEKISMPFAEAEKEGREPGFMDYYKSAFDAVTSGSLLSSLTKQSVDKESIGGKFLASMSETGRSITAEAQKELAENRVETDSLGVELAGDIVAGTIDMLPMLIAGRIGGTSAAGAVFGTQVSGHSYGASLEKGRTQAEALDAVKFDLFAEWLPEKFMVIDTLLRPGTTFFKKMVNATLGEGAQESLTEILQSAYDDVTLKDMSVKDAILNIDWSQVGKAGVVGAGVGASLSVPAHLTDRKPVDKPVDKTSFDASTDVPQQFTPTHKAKNGFSLQQVTAGGVPVPEQYWTAEGKRVTVKNAVPTPTQATPATESTLDVSPFEMDANIDAIRDEVMGEVTEGDFPNIIDSELEVPVLPDADVQVEDFPVIDEISDTKGFPSITKEIKSGVDVKGRTEKEQMFGTNEEIDAYLKDELNLDFLKGEQTISDKPLQDLVKLKSARKEIIKKKKEVDIKPTDLLAVIANKGGINRKYAEGIDPAEMNIRKGGVRPVFPVTGGMSMDEMGELLFDENFFQNERPEANEVIDLVGRAMAGEEIYTLEGTIAKSEADFELELIDSRIDRIDTLIEESTKYQKILKDDGDLAAEKYLEELQIGKQQEAEYESQYAYDYLEQEVGELDLDQEGKTYFELIKQAEKANPEQYEALVDRLIDEDAGMEVVTQELFKLINGEIDEKQAKAKEPTVDGGKVAEPKRQKAEVKEEIDEDLPEIFKRQSGLADEDIEEATGLPDMLQKQSGVGIDEETATAEHITEESEKAAASLENDKKAPTEEQIEAESYAKGHPVIQNLDIAIENPAGTKRRPGWPSMAAHYGDVVGYIGADGDAVDVFVKPDADIPTDNSVFIINQYVDGSFDEHKTMMGFADEADARKAYNDSFTKDWDGLNSIHELSIDEFKAWLETGDTKVEYGLPLAKQETGEKLDIGQEKPVISKTQSESDISEDVKSKTTKKELDESAAKSILDSANVTGTDRLDVMSKFRDGAYSLDDLRSAYPADVKPNNLLGLEPASGEAATILSPVIEEPEKVDVGQVSELSVTEYGNTFKTGEPVTFAYLHNKESATELFGLPDKDSDYGRGYEPAARFVIHVSKPKMPDYGDFDTGMLTFNNPLVIDNDGLKWKQTLSDKYDGKVGKELSKALIADGYDGVVTLDKFDSDGKYHTSEIIDLTTFDESKAMFSRVPDIDRPLSALHNMTAENLKFADEIGGLAVPSIGIVRGDMGIEGYGEITLIGTKDLGDPEKIEIRDADAYTSTFPTPEYKKVKVKYAQNLVDEIRPWIEKYHGRRGYALDATWDYAVNTPKPSEIIENWLRDNGIKAMFLKEVTGVDARVIKRDIRPQGHFAFSKSVRDYFSSADMSIQNKGWEDQERQQQFRDAANAVRIAMKEDLRETYKKTMPDASNKEIESLVSKDPILKSGSTYFNKDGALTFSYFEQLRNSQKDYGKQEVNEYVIQDKLDKKLKGKESQFKNWATGKVMDIFGEPLLTINRKKVPYTLDNIVDYMTRGGTHAQEQTMTFGPGKARAVSSKKFTDLTWMRNVAEYDLKPKHELKESRDKADKLLEEFRDEVISFYKYKDYRGEVDTWSALDDSMKVVAKWAQTRLKYNSKAVFRKALGSNGFPGVPSHIVDIGIKAGEAMLDAPVPYFEAKPHRAVGLDEFAGAVVPNDTSKETLSILDKHDIVYKKYGKRYDEEARTSAVVKLRNQLFKKGKDVLFERGADEQQAMGTNDVKIITADLQNDVGANIEVVDTEASLPEEIIAQAEKEGAVGEIRAVHWKGDIYIVADQMRDRTDVEASVLHESSHYAGDNYFGKEKGAAYQALWMKIGGVKGIKKLAKQAGFKMDSYFKTADKLIQDETINSRERAVYLVDEFLAHTKQQQAYESFPARIKRIIKEFYGKIRDLLRKSGFSDLPKANDADVAFLLKTMNSSVRGKPKGSKLNKVPAFMTFHHGSPHRFEKFSMEAVGTGEGAQAYGHGLYFAESKDVAGAYQQNVPHAQMVRDFLDALPENAEIDEVMELIGESVFSDNQESVLKALDKDDWLGFDYPSQAISAAYKSIDNYDPSNELKEAVESTGVMYEVNIPDEHIANFLDWDVPLSEQPESVQSALNKISSYDGKRFNFKNLTGGEIYYKINTKFLPKDSKKLLNKYKSRTSYQKLASETLNSLGIKGIKYYDAGSRGVTDKYHVQGGEQPLAFNDKSKALLHIKKYGGTLSETEQTRNLVVFDESIIEITAINGESVTKAEADEVISEMLEVAAEDVPVFSRAAGGDIPPTPITPQLALEPVGESLGMPEETLKQKGIRLFQDAFNRIKTLQEEIIERGGIITEDSDVYRAEERSSGKIAAELVLLDRSFMKPFIADLKESGITLEELDRFLIARHAQERNEWIAKHNENMPDGGSGMLNAEAQAILDGIDAQGLTEQYSTLANHVYEVNNKHLDTLVQGGHMKAEDADALRSRWQYYVPLKGKVGEDGRPVVGQGYSVSGAGIKKAMGRGAGNLAESPTSHAFAQAESAIVRTGKTKVGQALVRLMLDNPDPGFWSMSQRTFSKFISMDGDFIEGYDKPPIGLVDGTDYHRVMAFTPEEVELAAREGRKPNKQVVYRLDPKYKYRDDVFSVMIEGEEYLINIKDNLVFEQLKKMNSNKLNSVVAAAGSVNRYLAMINTALNPEFVITNLERDFQTAMVNLSGEQSSAMALKVAKNLPSAARGIWQSVFETEGDSPWRAEFEEMQQEGGSIGFFGLEDIETKVKHIQRRLENTNTVMGHTKESIKLVRDTILDANLAVENAARLSAYKIAKEQFIADGFSQSEARLKAASISKNLTVNFNRKGELAPLLNSAYLFYNASIQGSFRIFSALKHKRVQKIVGGIAMSAFGMAMYNMMAGGDDEDGVSHWEKIPPYLKQTNMIFMHPDGSGEYTKVRLPYGYNVFHYTGTAMHDLMYGKNTTVMGTAFDMASAVMNAFNPISGADFLDTVTPTVLKPFEQDVRNIKFTGKGIRPEYAFDQYDRPESEKYFKSTDPILRQLMIDLNELTGGDPTHAGFIDVSPETVKHYIGWVTGGAGMFAGRTVTLATKAATGEEIEARDIPFARTVVGKVGVQYDNERFYSAIKEINATKERSNQLKGSGEYSTHRKENRKIIALHLRIGKYKRRIKGLKDKRNRAYERGDKAQAKDYSEQIHSKMLEFLKEYDKAQAE